jgi:glyoxylase-like metal-dependent hydrolase (beta-lactamase superfamily II)
MTPYITRRAFIARATAGAAQLAVAPSIVRSAWVRRPANRVVARESFANLQQVSDGIWALISTPTAGDPNRNMTLCNGGIIAGRDAVLAVEGFYTPAGATWLGNQCKALTGRWPTHVVVTHYHADHANGVAGYLSSTARPEIRSTATTRDDVIARNKPADPARETALQGAVMLSLTEPTTLDLGGRVVRAVPRIGHTNSDVSLELDDPKVIFCGDLFWNSLLPNYVDAIPTKLAQSVKALRRDAETVYVSGHGGLGSLADYDRYTAVIGEVEKAARDAHQRGVSAEDLSGTYKLPESLGVTAGKRGLLVAFNAWYKELGQ